MDALQTFCCDCRITDDITHLEPCELHERWHKILMQQGRCIVHNCENHPSQGEFVGNMCSPCHSFITTGRGTFSQAFRNGVLASELTKRRL